MNIENEIKALIEYEMNSKQHIIEKKALISSEINKLRELKKISYDNLVKLSGLSKRTVHWNMRGHQVSLESLKIIYDSIKNF